MRIMRIFVAVPLSCARGVMIGQIPTHARLYLTLEYFQKGTEPET